MQERRKVDHFRPLSREFLIKNAFVEKGIGKEKHIESILFKFLKEAAFSSEAQKRQSEFIDMKERGKCYVKVRCSDARASSILDSSNLYSISEVAAAINPGNYRDLLRDPGSSVIIIYGHVDQELTKEKGKPDGCGGGHARSVIEGGGHLNGAGAGISRFVDEKVKTSDPILLAWLNAKEISRLAPNKIVLASILDHITHKLYIFGAIWKGGAEEYIDINPHGRFQTKYFVNGGLVKEISTKGLPPDIAKEILYVRNLNEQQREKLKTDDKDFQRSQKTQDPLVLHLGIGVPSLRVRYPGVFDNPNTAFSVRVPVIKQKGGGRRGSEMRVEDALDQIEYVFPQVVSSNQKGEGPFLHTKTVLLEATSEDQIREMLEKLQYVNGFKDWIKIGGKIIFSIVNKNSTVVEEIHQLRTTYVEESDSVQIS